MKAMLSQPMAGKSETEIKETREKAIKVLETLGYEVVNTLFTYEWYSPEAMKERGVVQIPLCFLAKSLENMSKCDAAYFCAGWEKARGCRIEHDAAKAYGLKIIYENDCVGQENSPVTEEKKEEFRQAFEVLLNAKGAKLLLYGSVMDKNGLTDTMRLASEGLSKLDSLLMMNNWQTKEIQELYMEETRNAPEKG